MAADSDSPAPAPRTGPFCRPPLVWMTLLAAGLTGWSLYLRSAPVAVIAWPPVCFGVPLALFVVADYCIRLVRCAARRTLHPRNWRWYGLPLLIVFGVSGWQTKWPLRVGFELSRPAFERAATELLARVPSTQPYANTGCLEQRYPYRMRLGGYQVEFVHVFPDERLVFFVTGGFFRASWGFVYDPDGKASAGSETQPHNWETHPLVSSWATFVEARP
jgi:hypothetical protein